MNDQLREYIAKERARGVDDEQLRQELLSKGWDPIAVHRLVAGEASVKTESQLHLSGTNVLLITGLSLIFIAAVTFIGYSWPQLSPLSRFLLIAIPNFFLFAIGSFLAKGDELKTVKETTHMAAHLMLPITAGVFLYQFGYYEKADALLMAYSVLLALPLSLYAALVKQRSYGALLVTLNLIALAIFLLTDQDLNGWRSSLILTVVSLLGLITAWVYKKRGQEESIPALVSAGTILYIISFSSLVSDVTRQVTSDRTAIIGFAAIITGVGLLKTAALFGHLFKPWTRLEFFHQRLLIAAAMLITFITLIGAEGGETILTVISVVFSAIVVIIGMETRVKFMTVLGLVGGSISLLSLLFSNIDRVMVVVLMFIVGFAAILLSIFLAKRGSVSTIEAAPTWNVGFIDDKTAATLTVKTGEAPTFFTVLVRILLAFLLYALIQFIFMNSVRYDETPVPYGDTAELI